MRIDDLEPMGRALQRLSVPGQHCTSTLARDKHGLGHLDPTDPCAAQWCAIGAMQREGVRAEVVREFGAWLLLRCEDLPRLTPVTGDSATAVWVVNDMTTRGYGPQRLRALLREWLLAETAKLLPAPQAVAVVTKEEPVCVSL